MVVDLAVEVGDGDAVKDRERRCEPERIAPLMHRRMVDHPLAAWALENGSIISIALLRSRLRMPLRQSFFRLWLVTYAGSLVLVEGSMLLQKFLVDKVYAHLPFFSPASEKHSQTPFRQLLAEWWRYNCRTHVLSSGMVALLLFLRPPNVHQALRNPKSFSLVRLLGKLALARLVSDVVFYGVHRALHFSQSWYRLHKRHHEHTSTGLSSNLHFTVPDLLLEGVVPLMSGMLALEGLKIPADNLEGNLIAAYIQWFEIGSHSGKPVPTVTIFPPLAPLYRLVLGNVDARNIEFHDCHHAYRNCNYGITQWVDYLMGTVRLRDRCTL